ncbi:hypothetical protein ACTA71_010528 [Dictyostelium dimigraforme]
MNGKTPFKLSNDWIFNKEIGKIGKSFNNSTSNINIDQDMYNLLKLRLLKKCISLKILNDDKKSRIIVEDLFKMAIYCFPLIIDPEQLNLIGEIIIWGFLLDDVFEEIPINRKQFETQQSIWLFGQSFEICSQFDSWAIELRKSIQLYCGENEILFNRFINSGITTIEGTLSFHCGNYSSIDQLDNFFNIRIQNSSVGFLNNFNHLFILKSLPTSILYDPILEKMEKIQSLLLGLINDLYSYEKEVILNEEKKNIIFLFSNEQQHQHHQKLQQYQNDNQITDSIKKVYDLINDNILTYQNLEIKIKEKYINTFKTNSEEDEFIIIINAQKYLIYGFIKYSIESRRYNCKELNQLLYKFKNQF